MSSSLSADAAVALRVQPVDEVLDRVERSVPYERSHARYLVEDIAIAKARRGLRHRGRRYAATARPGRGAPQAR